MLLSNAMIRLRGHVKFQYLIYSSKGFTFSRSSLSSIFFVIVPKYSPGGNLPTAF